MYLNEYIIIYGLKNKMQAIRIFYLVGSAQCKHEIYAVTYMYFRFPGDTQITLENCGTVMEAIHNAEVSCLLCL